ncbi:hypothetical protein MICAD_1230006 [Microcystis aeruginosa PCC 7941]|nr:hypothetical protein MICAD_1230006 [Microcystis aeruginosa PCC 7941]
MVSIHTLHELEASFSGDMRWMQNGQDGFHSYASRIGSKHKVHEPSLRRFAVSIHTLHELEARIHGDGCCPEKRGFHSYASRIGSKLAEVRPYVTVDVSIHTLHELEASCEEKKDKYEWTEEVSIHTLHELEARLALQS